MIPPQICLLRPDKAGDALKTLPVLRALVAADVTADFHLLCSEHNSAIFTHEPGIRTHSLPKNWKSMKGDKLLSSLQQKGMPPQFDKVINLLCDPFPESDALLRWLPAARKYSASVTDPSLAESLPIEKLDLPGATPSGRDETANIALLVGQALGIAVSETVDKFSAAPRILPVDEQEAVEIMGPKRGAWLGFCLFAGTTQRTHPLRRWERFLPKVTRDGSFQRFFLFGLPSDYARLEKLRSRCERQEDIELCFPSSFRALGAYLLRLDGVVAVDSGPLHLALSLGIRSLGILSGGDTARWFSRVGEGDVLLRRGLLNRYPTVFEMHRAFRKWTLPTTESPLFAPTVAQVES